MSDGTTHYEGCFESGPKHYECALAEISRLRLTITHLRAELEKKAWFSAYEKKPWVGLTDDEIKGCIEATIEITDCLLLDAVNAVIIDVETMLRRKNI